MKGQAFDTFKLMIAAVVAVAILGILMGILSQLSLPTGNPETVFQSMMSTCVQNPDAVKTSEVVTFKGSKDDVVGFSKQLQSAGVQSIASFTCTGFSSTVACDGGAIPTVTFKSAASFSARFRVDCNGATAVASDPTVELTKP